MNALSSGERTLFVGTRTSVRHFRCELVARKYHCLYRRLKAQFSDELWLQVNLVMERVKKKNSMLTAIVTDTDFEHYLKLLNQTLTGNADIKLICIEAVTDTSWQSHSGSITQRLKALALRHHVAVLLAVGVTHYTTDIRVPECLPAYWDALDYSDGILLCEQPSADTLDKRTRPRSVKVCYNSRTGTPPPQRGIG